MKMAENLPSVTSSLDTYSAMGEFSRQQIYIFLFFPQKIGLTFHANCLLKETICMKCQILFSGKNNKKYFKMSSAEIFLPSMLSLFVKIVSHCL